MLIFDENASPIIIDEICAPVISNYYWVLDLQLQDFTLAPLHVIEEVICPTVVLRIDGFDFPVPAAWSILVFDTDTTQLDTIELSEAAGREFTALVYGPTTATPTASVVAVVDYFVEKKNVGPALNKHQMLCHPIGPTSWVNIAPSDVYSKYLKNTTVSDLINF